MDEINMEADNMIQIEEIKLEPYDPLENHLQDSTTMLDEPSTLSCVVKQECGEEEELQSPVAVFLEPDEDSKEIVEESKDPLAVCSEDLREVSILRHIQPKIQGCKEKKRSHWPEGDSGVHFVCVCRFANAKEAEDYFLMYPQAKLYRHPSCVPGISGEPSYMKTDTPDSSVGFKCPICKKEMSRSSKYYHMETHRREKPHECKVCKKRFVNPAHVRVHMRAHPEERHKCPICLKHFLQEETLAHHMRNHSGKKSFECITLT